METTKYSLSARIQVVCLKDEAPECETQGGWEHARWREQWVTFRAIINMESGGSAANRA